MKNNCGFGQFTSENTVIERQKNERKQQRKNLFRGTVTTLAFAMAIYAINDIQTEEEIAWQQKEAVCEIFTNANIKRCGEEALKEFKLASKQRASAAVEPQEHQQDDTADLSSMSPHNG